MLKIKRSRKRFRLSVEDMKKMEEWLQDECIPTIGYALTEEDVENKLNLKVEYIDPSKLGEHTEAILCPSLTPEYNGEIKISTRLEGKAFTYLHEVIHYLHDVGIGNKVETIYTRKSRGHTNDGHEQLINYATAAYIIPYKEIELRINEFDSSRPWADELFFVKSICGRYNQSQEVVIRRIQEVRRLMNRKLKKNRK